MATIKCIFCGGSPTSVEDVLSDWIGRKLMLDKPQPSRPDRVVAAKLRRGHSAFKDEPGNESEWHTTTQPRFLAKCVCETCNNQWMSDIETKAKPSLVEMIEGHSVGLDQAQQEAVAKWLALKALVGQYLRSDQSPLLNAWVSSFYLEKRPPASWQIRIGCYEGSQTVSMLSTPIDTTVVHQLVPFAFKRPGFIFIFVIGKFIGQVFGTDQAQYIVPPSGHFIQIWPHSLLRGYGPVRAYGDVEAWPPQRRLDDSQLEKCARDPAEPRE